MKISLLCPTRKRPDNIKRLCHSLEATTKDKTNLELVFYIDHDDEDSKSLLALLQVDFELKYITGDRIVLSQMWNECYKSCSGEILGHMGDDIIFQTQGWDDIVRSAFSEYNDRIVFVFGTDGAGYTNSRNFGTHGFIHRNWATTVGYFVPPHYSSDYNDTHLNEVADILKRKREVNIVTMHMHPSLGKGEWDETHQDRLARAKRDNVHELYKQKRHERIADADKLQKFINDFRPNGS